MDSVSARLVNSCSVFARCGMASLVALAWVGLVASSVTGDVLQLGAVGERAGLSDLFIDRQRPGLDGDLRGGGAGEQGLQWSSAAVVAGLAAGRRRRIGGVAAGDRAGVPVGQAVPVCFV